MLTLAIDTSTSAITAAVADGAQVLSTASVLDPRGHTEQLAPTIAAALDRAVVGVGQLDRIAVGVGPGPFTGLRVGLVTAVTMGYALGIAVHGVCSLDALARQAAESIGGEFVVATDARRKEVYWATYRASEAGAERSGEVAVARPADLPERVQRLPVVGRGAVLYPEILGALALDRDQHPMLDVDAAWVARLADEFVAAGRTTPVEPMYLRRPDALTTAERAAP